MKLAELLPMMVYIKATSTSLSFEDIIKLSPLTMGIKANRYYVHFQGGIILLFFLYCNGKEFAPL